MNKRRANLEKMIALTLLAYAIGLLLGEAMRNVAYRAIAPSEIRLEMLAIPRAEQPPHKWRRYSGLFVLLKQQPRLPATVVRHTTRKAAEAFACLVLGNIRTLV